MHWDAYTIFSVLSGVVLMLTAFAPLGLSDKNRLWTFIAGLVFAGYGIYVAHQTSGFFVFPVEVFVIPVLGAGAFIFSAIAKAQSSQANSAGGAGGRSGAGAKQGELLETSMTFDRVHALVLQVTRSETPIAP